MKTECQYFTKQEAREHCPLTNDEDGIGNEEYTAGYYIRLNEPGMDTDWHGPFLHEYLAKQAMESVFS